MHETETEGSPRPMSLYCTCGRIQVAVVFIMATLGQTGSLACMSHVSERMYKCELMSNEGDVVYEVFHYYF